MGSFAAHDEQPHAEAAVEEWVMAAWTPAADLGLIHGFRRQTRERRGWQWSALARTGEPLLHVGEWDVPLRADPLLAKAPQLWGEWMCDAPFEQWTVGMETYAAALDEPADALGRAYGTATPIAWDVEWYATAAPEPVPSGYCQDGVVHAVIELLPGALRLDDVPARRWHRWGDALGPIMLRPVTAHVGLRAPFAFPDGTVSDWVLTGDGWRDRREVREWGGHGR